MKKQLIISFIIAIAISAIISVVVIFFHIQPISRQINNFNQNYQQISEAAGKKWIFPADTQMFQHQLRQAYLLAQLQVAKSDSVVLTIDLADSMAILSIKGMPVHRAKIFTYKTDRFFSALHPVALLQMLSMPMQASKHESTIKKVPLMVKIAPKDTSEYIPDVIADTSDFEPVNFMIETQNHIRFMILEELTDNHRFRWSKFKFNLFQRIKQEYYFLLSVVKKEDIFYIPSISLSVARRDAKIIYRAIPANASIILRIK